MNMKLLNFNVIIGLVLLLCSNLISQTNEYQLKIQINNNKAPNSNLVIKIWSNGNYMNSKPFREIILKSGPDFSFIADVNNLPIGEYGISVFQDINNNNKLDKTFFGKPKEPYGFSNNAKPYLGPPGYEKVKFTFNKDLQISINLQ